MEKKTSQVITERLHSPDEIVDSHGYPGDRPIDTHMKSGEHPAKLLPAQTSIIRIVEENRLVVPIDKSVL